MRTATIEIGVPGIKQALRRFDPHKAVAEYVWNGFDAGAREVNINYQLGDLGAIKQFSISDNGSGIPSAELNKKFRPLLHSNKQTDPPAVQYGPSAVHGRNGIGRLTFMKFATAAQWTTTYKTSSSEYRQYAIRVRADHLNKFESDEESVVDGPSGTTVDFTNILHLSSFSINALIDYLSAEFAWFLELKAPYERLIKINGRKLRYESLIADKKDFTVKTETKTGDKIFQVRYVLWRERLHNEYSYYYFIDSKGCERAKETTSFNNKGDGFYHSMYVHGDHFDSIEDVNLAITNDTADQQFLFQAIERDETYRELGNKLDEFLRQKRSPFLRRRAVKYIGELEKENVFPEFALDTWEQYRSNELKEVVRGLYQADPRIFSDLNFQQK